jgi:ribosomal protein S18 acetylase RimI-like enzyme
MTVQPLAAVDPEALSTFLGRVSEGDRTFFKENVDDPDVRAAWMRGEGSRSLALDGDEVVGYVAVVPLQGWSSHVGEVRVVVDESYRGRGIGRALARHAVLQALELGLTKMVVEVTADSEPTIAMFRSLGFDPEALLKDHVRDYTGRLHDLMILAHSVEESLAAMTAAGIADGVGGA